MAASKLTLDTTDERWAEMLAAWTDGAEYDLTLHVLQDSPGNFSVLSASESAIPEEEAAPVEEAVEEKPTHPMGKKYPRIAVLIGGKDK